ncbi:hypothetical protein [Streptomonospora alba]|uniref:hypothetical protein n=1 Tax=Streptomonospora alba TaxID=183763 RepID=UPI0012ECDF7E|nr:hypothetical protein [Streptomonospora alba]
MPPSGRDDLRNAGEATNLFIPLQVVDAFIEFFSFVLRLLWISWGGEPWIDVIDAGVESIFWRVGLPFPVVRMFAGLIGRAAGMCGRKILVVEEISKLRAAASDSVTVYGRSAFHEGSEICSR